MVELLTKTSHSLDFASKDLLSALNKSNAVESIVILKLIEDLSKVQADLAKFKGAVINNG